MARRTFVTNAAALAALLALAAFACAGEAEPAGEGSDVRGTASRNAAFALDLYKQLSSARAGENLFFSPHSISSALAMTYAGARGVTAQEMSSVLRFPEQGAGLHAAMSALNEILSGRASQEGIELSVANALWGQTGYPFLKPFLETVRTHYGAGLRSVDFAGDTERSRLTINAWAEDETEGLIKDLLAPQNVTPGTTLVLTNAVYFKGDWATMFDEANTRDGEFYVGPDSTVTVPLMRRTGSYKWADYEGARVFELPYAGGELSMVIVAPVRADGFAGIGALLEPSHVSAMFELIDSSSPSEATVIVPRFKLESAVELSDTLSGMGMPSAFRAGAADFTGMSATRELFISNVVHKGFVSVDERGTEAAAATAVAMLKAVAVVQELRADRPFVFFIRDRETGAVLFMGRVVNPEA